MQIGLKPEPRFACNEDHSLPAQAGVVVIGAGIVGLTAALNLAHWKIPVVLIEKGVVGAEQSSRNWGWVRIQGRNAGEVPLMLSSREQWQTLNKQSGTDFGFRQSGVTYLAPDQSTLEQQSQFLATAKAFDLDTQLLGNAQMRQMFGDDANGYVGALHTASDYRAEPALAMAAIADLAVQNGVQIFEHCAARNLSIQNKQVKGVVTEHGLVQCDQVILAGGAWSRIFLENHQFQLPQLGVISSAQRSSPVNLPFDSAVGTPGISIRPRLDGGVTMGQVHRGRFYMIPAAFRQLASFLPLLRSGNRRISLRAGRSFFGPMGRHRWQPDQVSPFESMRVLNPTPDHRQLDQMLATAQQTFAPLANMHVVHRWAGMIDVMPDELPVIDQLSSLNGLVLATGFSGHGFGLGPGAGLLAAQLATSRQPVVDPSPFRAARFKSLDAGPAEPPNQALVQTR